MQINAMMRRMSGVVDAKRFDCELELGPGEGGEKIEILVLAHNGAGKWR